jgi:hypothetical protein
MVANHCNLKLNCKKLGKIEPFQPVNKTCNLKFIMQNQRPDVGKSLNKKYYCFDSFQIEKSTFGPLILNFCKTNQ